MSLHECGGDTDRQRGYDFAGELRSSDEPVEPTVDVGMKIGERISGRDDPFRIDEPGDVDEREIQSIPLRFRTIRVFWEQDDPWACRR